MLLLPHGGSSKPIFKTRVLWLSVDETDVSHLFVADSQHDWVVKTMIEQ